MGLEVEVGAVGDALNLAPAPGVEVLDVVGGLGVVGELVGLVGSESQAFGVDAEAGVPRHAVVDPLPVPLLVVARLDEELDLHDLELAGAEDEVAGGDLVAEGLADLGDAERELAASGVEDVVEVYEDALCGLGPEVDPVFVGLDGADVGLKHEVELPGFGEGAGLAAVGTGVALKVVGAEALAAAAAVDEGVGEVFDVAAGTPDLGVHEDGGVEADHVAASPYEGLPPVALDVVLELDAEGAVVPGAGESAVDLAALEEEAPAAA